MLRSWFFNDSQVGREAVKDFHRSNLAHCVYVLASPTSEGMRGRSTTLPLAVSLIFLLLFCGREVPFSTHSWRYGKRRIWRMTWECDGFQRTAYPAQVTSATVSSLLYNSFGLIAKATLRWQPRELIKVTGRPSCVYNAFIIFYWTLLY